MKHNNYCRSAIIFLFTIILFSSCSSSKEFSGFSYDPEGSTVTTDKEIQLQHKHAMGITKDGVWVSNEFAGARMNNFYKVNDSLYRVVIEPENHPVNNSPWYAFKAWSNEPKTVDIQLQYKHGQHRYRPKLSTDGKQWRNIRPANLSTDTAAGTATLTLQLDREPLWVSAQELLTFKDMRQWADSIASANSYAKLDTIGYSHYQRPLLKMKISDDTKSPEKGVLVVIGRQHPPEVTGGLASQTFIETVSGDSELAQRFRQKFEVWAYPLANPDGVQQGHWRHNGAGIDLNRDWQAFNQPETQSIRDDLYPLKNDKSRKVYYGVDFHSTNENIFYPINKEVSTFPEDFTYSWIKMLKEEFPDTELAVKSFDTSSPIAKNWLYHTFGADAVTYEVDDAADRARTYDIAHESARIIMKKLLESYEQTKH